MAPSEANQRKTLVTGGAGFIGSHLVEQLVRRGDHVVVIDDLSTGRRANLSAVADRITFIEAKVSSAIGELEPGVFDEIYHLAAAVGVRLIVEAPIESIETNVQETAGILEYAALRGTPVLVASSSEVYGKSTRTPFSEDDDVVYGPTTFNRWSYACSKALDEYLAIAYARSRSLPTVIVRFFNTVGPRQLGDYGMVVPRFVKAALQGGPLEVYGDGAQSRCFCDVRDVVDALPRLLAYSAAAGRVFNLGSDEPISIRELADLVCRTLGVEADIKAVSYEQAYGQPIDDLRVRQPDLRRIREIIDFQPRIALAQTIRDLAAEMAGATPSVESIA